MGTAVAACLGGGDAQCAGALAATRSLIQDQLPGLLDSLYAQVAEAAPGARVVVTGYPHLFSPKFGPYFGASTAEQQALNEGADQLNAVIADAAAHHGFQFVDVTRRFDGHGVNAPDPSISAPAPAASTPTRRATRPTRRRSPRRSSPPGCGSAQVSHDDPRRP